MTRAIKTHIALYNDLEGVSTPPFKCRLELNDTLQEDLTSSGSMDFIVNQKMLQTFRLKERAEEEICLIKRDMTSSLVFFQAQVNALNTARNNGSNIAAYLTSQQWKMELFLKDLHSNFAAIVGGTTTSTPLYDDLRSRQLYAVVETGTEYETEDEPNMDTSSLLFGDFSSSDED